MSSGANALPHFLAPSNVIVKLLWRKVFFTSELCCDTRGVCSTNNSNNKWKLTKSFTWLTVHCRIFRKLTKRTSTPVRLRSVRPLLEGKLTVQMSSTSTSTSVSSGFPIHHPATNELWKQREDCLSRSLLTVTPHWKCFCGIDDVYREFPSANQYALSHTQGRRNVFHLSGWPDGGPDLLSGNYSPPPRSFKLLVCSSFLAFATPPLQPFPHRDDRKLSKLDEVFSAPSGWFFWQCA